MDRAGTPARPANRAVEVVTPETPLLADPRANSGIVLPALARTAPAHDICRLLVQCAAEGMCGIDSQGFIIFVNPALAGMTGWSEEELVGRPYHAFMGHLPNLPICLETSAASRLAPEATHGVMECSGQDTLFLRKDGSSFPAAYRCATSDREICSSVTVVVFQDISEKCRAEQWEKTRADIFSAIRSNQALLTTMHMLADAFVARYPGRSIAILLRREEELYLGAEAGWPPRAACTAPVAPDFRELSMPGFELSFVSSLLSAVGERWGAVAVFDRASGKLDDAIRGTIQRICDLACVAIEHHQLYEAAAQRAEGDSLQASPGRLFLEKCLQPAMRTAKQRGKIIAVGYLDLDRLKQINSSLGHDYGDDLIMAVDQRLNQCLRDVDIPLRYSGDGFVFALCDLNEPGEAEEVSRRLLRELRTPFLVKGHLLATTASIGISIFPQHGDSPDLLLRNADTAMQAVKQADRGGVRVYSAALGKQSRRAAEISGALSHALQERQFYIDYQPIYTVHKQLAAFEALLRWRHPRWGLISPREFVPIAERGGLIVPIGDWVIQEVCQQVMKWGESKSADIRFFVNVSGVQLERPDFSSKIANTLQSCGLAPERLELEITESWVISDLKGAARKLLVLRDLGIGIAIDDFGTGYSSFNYLQELPLDTIKIDRSFIHRLNGSDARPITVRVITGMAQQLGLKIVAEGVENPEQAAELADIGCDLMQGFWLSRPLKPQEAASLLRQHSALGNISILHSSPSPALS